MLRNARTVLNGTPDADANAMFRINHNSTLGDSHLVLFETQNNDYARLDFMSTAPPASRTYWTIAGKSNGDGNDPALLNFFHNQFGNVLSLNRNGSATLAGTLTQNSDCRLKRDFQPLSARSSLSQLTQLNGYQYHWREANQSQNLQTGLIAQEVQKLFPELVETDAKGYLSVNYIGLVPHLIESVKALAGRNEQLEKASQTLSTENGQLRADMADLKTRLEALERRTIRNQND